MSKSRMEAFSDGAIAVIITTMVLEMKSPHGTNLAALQPLVPVFLSYVLSFVCVGTIGTTITTSYMRPSTSKVLVLDVLGHAGAADAQNAAARKPKSESREIFKLAPVVPAKN